MSNDLVSMVRDAEGLTLVIFTGALLMARILPMLVLSPFLGGDLVEAQTKVGAGLLLTIVMYPAVAGQIEPAQVNAFTFVALLLKEVFIGVVIAFFVGMVFEAAQVAGSVLDTLSGTNMAQVMVPQLQQNASIFSSLKMQLAIVLFLSLNGHHRVIEAMADSLALIPLAGFPSFSQGQWPFFENVLLTFGKLLGIGLTLAAPALLAAFLTDLSLGMINRVAPQIQVFFISMSIKPVVVTVMTLLSIHLLMQRLELEFIDMLKLLRDSLGLMA
jgi:flagellar biosynthetic protein FliR